MEELDVKQIAKYIYQRKNILIYILLVAILIGIFYTFIIKRPNYEVTAQILIDKADASIENFVISKDILNNENIESKFDKTSKIINITTTTNKAEESFNITNQYIEKLKTKLEEIYDIKTFKMITTPQLPQKASNISYGKDILISLLIGFIAYITYIILMFSLRGVTSSIEIENITGLNVLGEVSLENKKNKKESIPYDTKNKCIIDDLKRIEANIEFNKQNKKPKIILLTGTENKVGNSYIVNNLASQYSKIYNKVLLIDTDIISKTLTKYYTKKEEKGLTNILETNKIAEIEKLIQKTQKENIYFLPAGNNKIEEDIFLQENINNVLEEIKNKYDIILIDTLAINESVIPIHLANIADATIITIETGKTKIESIQKAKSTIEKVGGKITGIIMNKTF